MAFFGSSTPQCMKDKKLYDEDSKFTDEDLDDVVQGLLKLGVSDSNNIFPTTSLQKQSSIDSFQPLTTRLSSTNSQTPLSINPQNRSSTLSLSAKSNHSNRKSKSNTTPNPYLNLDQDIKENKSPNRHSPLYKQQPSFIANSKQVRQKRQRQFAGIYSLMAAVNKVEQRDVFKIDIADINRITATYTPDQVDCVWDKETRTLKCKSKNAISVPKDDDYDNDYFNTSFQDLNDDFTPITNMDRRDSLLSMQSRDDRRQPRLSNISSIAGRSSIGLLGDIDETNYYYSSPNQPSPKQRQKRKFDNDLNDIIANKIEQQHETRRQSREWSQQNLKEIDEMYHNKNKLQSKQNNSQYSNNKHNDIISSAMKSKADSVDIVCREFNESNISSSNIVKDYEDNLKKATQNYLEHRAKPRQQQNNLLQQQLQIMQDKIDKHEQNEKKLNEARLAAIKKQKEEQEKARMDQQNKKKAGQAQPGQLPQSMPSPAQSATSVLSATQPGAQQQQHQQQGPNLQGAWYPHEAELSKIYNNYKTMWKKCEELIAKFENDNGNLFDNLEMKVGLIVRAISSNQKSVFDAYKRYQKLVNENTKQGTIERNFCFIHLTLTIIEDTRIIKQSAQKFASAYFLSFIMMEYKNEYLDIFKCCFYHYCIFTIPYINKQLRDVALKLSNHNPLKPSIVRCQLLGYKPIKDENREPTDKRKYLQRFPKANNAGISIWESEEDYFNRTHAICSLYAAFMSIRNNNTFSNPIGIDSGDCWKWIAHLLSLPTCVYPELCSILSGIIEIIGHDMLEKYPKQFPKILMYINQNIQNQCDASTSTRSKAGRELALFIKQVQKDSIKNNGKLTIEKPKESKLIKKTVGNLLLQQGN